MARRTLPFSWRSAGGCFLEELWMSLSVPIHIRHAATVTPLRVGSGRQGCSRGRICPTMALAPLLRVPASIWAFNYGTDIGGARSGTRTLHACID